MSTIKDIVKDVIALEQLVLEQDGELNETLEVWMQLNADNMADKIDGYSYFIDRLEIGMDYLKAKENELKAARKAYENMIERLQFNLRLTMDMLNIDELRGHDYRYKRTEGKPRVEIYDEQELPLNMMREKINYEPDKDKIKDAIESGNQVLGARLIASTQLRRYINKKELERK